MLPLINWVDRSDTNRQIYQLELSRFYVLTSNTAMEINMMSKQLEHSEQNPGIAYQTKVDSSSEILTDRKSVV